MPRVRILIQKRQKAISPGYIICKLREAGVRRREEIRQRALKHHLKNVLMFLRGELSIVTPESKEDE